MNVLTTLLMMRGLEGIRWHVGRLGVWIRYWSASWRVPAYRHFCATNCAATHSIRLAMSREFDGIPVTDKTNYVNAYTMAQRCVGGALPSKGVLIDESSGSSGVPTNWIRGSREREANARTIRRGLEHRFGREPLMVINAFALGPWATGINLTLALASWNRMKALGPDISKIANTLRYFGTNERYLIMGYPPFLKQLLDLAGIEWKRYNVSFVCGGEGMSESLRRYMQERGITRVYGSFGASDLELNIAAESDFTIALRRLLESRSDIAERLMQHRGALPMIFQFNPAEFFLESTTSGELLVTVCRPHYVAPKVRYNIHDLGHVVRMPELVRVLAEFGVDARSLDANALDLPLLFHYGRSDMSVSWYGCKIPPADVQEALFRLPLLSAHVDGFQLIAYDDANGDKRLEVAIEVAAERTIFEHVGLATAFFNALEVVNQDFRESRRIAPAHKPPTLSFFASGTGPFAGADNRIKRQYLSSRAA